MYVLGGFAALPPVPTASVCFVTLDPKALHQHQWKQDGYRSYECETNSEEVLETDADSIFGNSFPKLKKKGFPKMTENEFATSAKSGLWVTCP